MKRTLLLRANHTDDDPDNPENVILLCTGRSHPKPGKVSSVLNPSHEPRARLAEVAWIPE